MTYYLGVDLGTTYTAAAVWRDGRVEMASLGNRAPVVPSVVLPRDDGEALVGEAAERRATTEPERIAREFKRRVGDSTPIILGGAPYSTDTLMARQLAWVVARAGEAEGGPPDGVVVCHPANWGAFKIDVLHQAIARAEVAGASTVTEPEAAALHYASQQRVPPGSVVAVYDLGGGTFDAAVLRLGDTGWEILGEPQGVERLGGVDVDEAVFRHVVAAVDGALDGLDPDDPASLAAVARLRRDCVEAKEALSSDTDVSIPVLLPTRRTEVRLTRTELEHMVRPVLDETMDALRRTLRSADVAPEAVDAVLLVGGASRMPLVAAMVGAELGRPVAVDAHPKHGTALGAAMLAAERGTADAAGAAGTAGAAGHDAAPAPAPDPAPDPAPTDAASSHDAAPPAPATSHRRGRSLPLRALVGVGAVALVLGGALLWLSGRDGGGTDTGPEASAAGTSAAGDDDPCAEGSGRTVTTLEDVTIPAVEVEEQRVEDVELGGETIPGFTVPAVDIPERVVDAGCVIEHEPSDPGCLGAVEITGLEIPPVEVPGFEIPAAPTDGSGFAGEVVEDVRVDAVPVERVLVEEACPSDPDDPTERVYRDSAYRDAAYRESAYRDSGYRDRICVGEDCTNSVSVPSLSVSSVSVDAVSVPSASG